MSKFIATLVIAALLLTGTAAAVPANPANVPAVTQNSTADTTTPVVTVLTAEEAIAIALEHAGLTADAVTNVRSERDVDDRVPEWEIEFRSGEYEYDYTIHAETGTVLKWDKEYEPKKTEKPVQTEPAATEPPATQPPVTEPPVTEPETKELTKEEAIAIALKHAGLTEADVSRLEAKPDRDDSITEWEIDFRSGDHEYDYTVHAETGEILEWDKEYDPPKKQEVTPTEPPATEPPVTELTKEAAIAIALEHAGLTEAEVTRLKAEFDKDDRIPEWEVEFRVGRTEYEYTIHAETGEILEWDQEVDD